MHRHSRLFDSRTFLRQFEGNEPSSNGLPVWGSLVLFVIEHEVFRKIPARMELTHDLTIQDEVPWQATIEEDLLSRLPFPGLLIRRGIEFWLARIFLLPGEVERWVGGAMASHTRN